MTRDERIKAVATALSRTPFSSPLTLAKIAIAEYEKTLPSVEDMAEIIDNDLDQRYGDCDVFVHCSDDLAKQIHSLITGKGE